MKPPSRAPLFACLYPGLCDVARQHGYALTIHGSVTTDLDLVAVPWVETVSSPEMLLRAMMDHMGACLYEDMLRRDGLSEDLVKQIMDRRDNPKDPAFKPHGRLAWNLYLFYGTKVDLSIIPARA